MHVLPWPLHVARTTRVAVWGLYALTLALAPLLLHSSLSHSLLSQIGIAIIVCLSYNLLLGQGGMLSFGHAVYSGAGAFMAIHTLNRVSAGLALPVSLIPLAGGLASAALALPLGWISTRKTGTPLAMITLGLGELMWAMAPMFPAVFGGEGGVSGNRVAGAAVLGVSFGPQIELYYLIAGYTLVCTALMYALTRTPLGHMLGAVRDNPERVAFVGYDPQRVRWLAFVMAAFFAGISGGLAALNFEIVTSEVFSSSRSGAYLLFTFLGGTRFFVGPIIGAVLMVLSLVLLSAFTHAWALYLGALFVLMVVLAPGGLAALLMHNLRLARHGVWRRLGVAYLALGITALVAFGGLAAMVEMVYQLQLNAALGPTLSFLGATLDAQSLGSWTGALLALLTGLGLFELSRRQFVRDWRDIQQAIDQATPAGEAP